MHVLLVNHTSSIGGAEQSLLELVRELPRHGVTPAVALPQGPLASVLEDVGATVYPIPFHTVNRPRGVVTAFRTVAAIGADAARILRLLQRLRPDVVHANSVKSAFATGLAARCAGIPCLWHCRDLAPPGARTLLRIAPTAVAISRAVAASLPHPQRIRVVRNGIDLAHFDPAKHPRVTARDRLGLPPAVPLVAMVADFVPWKRHDLFLAAAARVRQSRRDVRFVVAGKDRTEHPGLGARLRDHAESLGLGSAVQWLGHCPDTALLYAAVDVLLHPPAREPFGRVVCEALAMNCPVVGADAAGPAEIATECPASTVRLVRPDDVDGFAAGVLDLLHPAEPRAPSRDAISRCFDIRRTAAEVAVLYAEVAAH